MDYNNSDCNCNQDCSFTKGINYCLFVGLDDKNKKAQTIPTAQAVSFAQKVCAKYFTEGFTILEGSGDDRGNLYNIETSLYIIAINATESSVIKVASILLKEFNISEVLIEKNLTNYLYFS